MNSGPDDSIDQCPTARSRQPFDPAAFNRHFDHHTPAFGRHREAIFDDLRQSCPVARTNAWGGFHILTRYEDIVRVAKDDATFSSEQGITLPGPPPAEAMRLPIFIDPPRAYFYRNILAKFFTLRWLADLEPWLRGMVNELVDDFIDAGSADLQTQLSHPMTARFIMHITGLPDELWYELSEPVIASVGSSQTDPSGFMRRMQASAILREQVAKQREKPTGSPVEKVIPYLLSIEPEGRKLSDDEVLAMLDLLLDGGFDTTLAALGHSFVYLGRNPDKRRQLIDDPSLMPTAIDEFLRWVSPQQGLFRTATIDTEIGGVSIAKGDKIYMAWPAGNHDPEIFPNPHEVRFDRKPNRHLTFGTGAHLCLGINVAKLEMRVALETVLQRLPDYQLVEKGIKQPDGLGIVNGMEHLPVIFSKPNR